MVKEEDPMPKRTSKKTSDKRRIKFSMKAPDATEVLLMGDFNKWSAKAHPMKNSGHGIWEKVTMLSPGRYEYKFLVDGNWKEDPENDQACPNSFNTYNNVLIVE